MNVRIGLPRGFGLPPQSSPELVQTFCPFVGLRNARFVAGTGTRAAQDANEQAADHQQSGRYIGSASNGWKADVTNDALKSS